MPSAWPVDFLPINKNEWFRSQESRHGSIQSQSKNNKNNFYCSDFFIEGVKKWKKSDEKSRIHLEEFLEKYPALIKSIGIGTQSCMIDATIFIHKKRNNDDTKRVWIIAFIKKDASEYIDSLYFSLTDKFISQKNTHLHNIIDLLRRKEEA